MLFSNWNKRSVKGRPHIIYRRFLSLSLTKNKCTKKHACEQLTKSTLQRIKPVNIEIMGISALITVAPDFSEWIQLLSLPHCAGWWKVLHRKPKLCTEQFHLWAPTSRQVSRPFVCRAMGWLPCLVEWGVSIWSEEMPNIECLLKPFSLFLCLSEHWARTREGREWRERRKEGEKGEKSTSKELRQLLPMLDVSNLLSDS